MNAESVLTGVIIGVLTGGITGYLAALYALRKFKAQRAFDRQLEWYERTVRALGAFSQLNHEQLAAERTGDLKKASEEAEKGFFNVERCVQEAVLYAEQTTYEHLLEMEGTYHEIKSCRDSGTGTLFGEVLEVGTLLNATLEELSKPVRKMLGLKEIALKPPEK